MIQENDLIKDLNCCVENTRNTINLVARKIGEQCANQETIPLARSYMVCLIHFSNLQQEHMDKIHVLFKVDSTECCNLFLLRDVTTKFVTRVSKYNNALLRLYDNNLDNITYTTCKNYMNNIVKLYKKYIKYIKAQSLCIDNNNIKGEDVDV